MITKVEDLGDLPGQTRLYLALTEEKVGSAVKRSLVVLNREYPGAQPRRVCEVKDGRPVVSPVPGTDGVPESERLALISMPASYGFRTDFLSLLRDPYWQAAIDMLLVEHVMGS